MNRTGFDTTSAAISWSIYMLAHSPEYQERLYEELRCLSPDEPIDSETLNSLKVNVNIPSSKSFLGVGFFSLFPEYIADHRGVCQGSASSFPVRTHDRQKIEKSNENRRSRVSCQYFHPDYDP